MNYRLTVYPALEAGNYVVNFGYQTADQMIYARDTVAGLLLYLQDEAEVMKDYSNVFLLEENIAGEWQEYEEE